VTTTGPAHDELQGFGLDARRAVVAAQDAARSLRHERVGTEHLLLGLLADPEVGSSLKDAGLTDGSARRKIAEAVPVVDGLDPKAPLPRTARCGRAIGRATRFARDDHAELVGSRHLLLGVLDVEGTAGQVLRGLGVDLEHLRAPMRRPEPIADTTTAEDGPEDPAQELVTLVVRCHQCAAPLTDGVTGTRLPLTGPSGGGGRTVLAVSCPVCGTLLGVAPG
jgi:ATP-dependent Clp protease ATP-binding subunit ClpA